MSEKIDYSKNYKRTIFTWSLYDFANQPFPTIIITFIYAAFFTQHISAGDEAADVYWLFSISLSAIIIALLSPIMGAIADRSGYRKTIHSKNHRVCKISENHPLKLYCMYQTHAFTNIWEMMKHNKWLPVCCHWIIKFCLRCKFISYGIF